jgi:hypothetical protein
MPSSSSSFLLFVVGGVEIATKLLLFSLYVTIFLSPLDEGLAGVSLLDRRCRGKALFSTRLDRSREIVLPLAAFLGQSMIGGTLLRAPII